MRNDEEYNLSKAISTYLKCQYPNVLFHFDYAGSNLSKAQAGKMKAIQKEKGYPDLFIPEPRKSYHGLYIELKKEGEVLYKINGELKTYHLRDQGEMIKKLRERGYKAGWAIGFDEAKEAIDAYLAKD